MLKYGRGEVYTTFNNFESVDSTLPVFDTISEPKNRHVIGYCTFSDGDRIAGYGTYWNHDTIVLGGPGSVEGFIVVSSDGGKSWGKPYVPPENKIFNVINCMTSLDRDTILATGESTNYFLRSTNQGVRWNVDSLILDTTFSAFAPHGLTFTASGHPIGIFSATPFIGDMSIIVRGEQLKSHVEVYERIVYNTHIFPDPATSVINILTIDVSRPVHIYDMLGREVLNGITSAQGILTLDVSHLVRGVYTVLLDHFGKMIPVGKVAIIGK